MVKHVGLMVAEILSGRYWSTGLVWII